MRSLVEYVIVDYVELLEEAIGVTYNPFTRVNARFFTNDYVTGIALEAHKALTITETPESVSFNVTLYPQLPPPPIASVDVYYAVKCIFKVSNKNSIGLVASAQEDSSEWMPLLWCDFHTADLHTTQQTFFRNCVSFLPDIIHCSHVVQLEAIWSDARINDVLSPFLGWIRRSSTNQIVSLNHISFTIQK